MTLSLILTGVSLALAFTSSLSKDAPVINPNFAVNSVEVDETNATILEQRLVFDIDLRRHMMYAEGSLVHGAMQQIKRCDIHPQGWFSSAGGPNINDPSSWTCTNMTISLIGELPKNCQYTSFWSFPDDMKYTGGTVSPNGVVCDEWEYFSGLDRYALWATTATDEATGQVYDVPVANGKVFSNTSSLWTIYYSNFVPGSAAEEEYEPVDGCACPASTPPSDDIV
jgi:hypothetical protein